MIANNTLFTFTPEEDAQYTLQTTLQQDRLLDADDALDLYSCHSQPHVLEVMEQCDVLLAAFDPWLKAMLPGVPRDWLRDHLLLAAKLHDVGMCGTPALRALLQATDSLHTLLTAPGAEPPALLEPYLLTLREQASPANLATRSWRDVLYYAEDAPRHEKPLIAARAAYHGEIKRAIRKQHAGNSGRWILQHRRALAAHYGPEVDLTAVAVLAALHSSSSLEKANIVPDGEHNARIRSLIRQMVAEEAGEAEAARITADEAFQRLVYPAALLRLADTRRSGSRLTNMDQSRLLCEVDPTGHISLCKVKDGLREAIPLRPSFEILASEAMTEFGTVAVYPNADGTWYVRHDVTLHHAEQDLIRRMFAQSRLQSYANELNTAALVSRLGFTHEIRLHLEGCKPLASGTAVKAWRSEAPWLKDDPLILTTI